MVIIQDQSVTIIHIDSSHFLSARENCQYMQITICKSVTVGEKGATIFFVSNLSLVVTLSGRKMCLV